MAALPKGPLSSAFGVPDRSRPRARTEAVLRVLGELGTTPGVIRVIFVGSAPAEPALTELQEVLTDKIEIGKIEIGRIMSSEA